MTQKQMYLIKVGDRLINLDRVNHAKHFIQQDHSYLELCFDCEIVQLRDSEAEQAWGYLETLCEKVLLEAIVQ
ncbi:MULTISPECIES: hypothetical protein [Leptolyngbya]|uniref:hypothetical protein n=1 Tax=Leptolyngbya TaxID=47251 RepID=UPI00168A3727|nr:hypothetical protein [Leptolyngbya sp. FACHB-1624]MBD1857968.1 hypothetical protein [Leptolyngbya sp. FACHB-1624]